MTGTASPSSQTASAEYSTVSTSVPPASATISPAIFRPSPVSVTTPTMMPAVAVVAATPRMSRPPDRSAMTRRDGVSAVSRRRKLSATARSVAQNTALNADIPTTMKTAIATSDVK